ncbi:hypothetical protein [Gracilinema caldarium]|jgi:hypothetical protein|uniref:Uncharacterized protein n=1 Tax=Gracilinema caldarium (strain ATCC 51460 / DSM 7334 / H1) TaxID=744872 RepID=F8F240_GRAC1|nr:hypothetical protein [Gracilinema caldarium]AEJ20312.1 hypothetical protein Spica_2192 [Gracilinema caldarium DSM 7334]AEJ20318.1 hypothetical protein Spica_2198 [Gracilinema caldarium DSM 7334]
MKTNIGLILLVFSFGYLFLNSLRSILIGKGILKHPMYDNEDKKKYLLKMGYISIPFTSLGFIFFVYLLIIAK